MKARASVARFSVWFVNLPAMWERTVALVFIDFSGFGGTVFGVTSFQPDRKSAADSPVNAPIILPDR
jgi:hypothetical protein